MTELSYTVCGDYAIPNLKLNNPGDQPIQTISEVSGFSQSKVTSMLHRLRGKLRKTLSEEGYV